MTETTDTKELIKAKARVQTALDHLDEALVQVDLGGRAAIQREIWDAQEELHHVVGASNDTKSGGSDDV